MRKAGNSWVKWLPSSWREAHLRRYAHLLTGGTPDKDRRDYWDDGSVPWLASGEVNKKRITTADACITELGLRSSSARWLPAGCVVMALAGQGKTKATVATLEFQATCNQSLAAMVPDEVNLHYRYLFYYLDSQYGNIRGLVGEQRDGLSLTHIASIWVPIPPLSTQGAIANYLDEKTADIDTLIEKKRKLLDLLAEERAAAISEALESLALDRVRLSRLADLLPGYAFASGEYSRLETDIRLLRGVNVMPGALRWDDVAYWPKHQTQGLNRFWLKPGDLVIGMDRPWIKGGLRLAAIQESDCPCLLLQRVARIRPRRELYGPYLQLTFEWARFQSHLEPETTGVSVPHISGDQILSFRIPLPDSGHQRAIVESINKIGESRQSVIGSIAAQIDRLQEYRQALITAAVTGQLDLGAAA